jgi:hypothetical protein
MRQDEARKRRENDKGKRRKGMGNKDMIAVMCHERLKGGIL